MGKHKAPHKKIHYGKAKYETYAQKYWKQMGGKRILPMENKPMTLEDWHPPRYDPKKHKLPKSKSPKTWHPPNFNPNKKKLKKHKQSGGNPLDFIRKTKPTQIYLNYLDTVGKVPGMKKFTDFAKEVNQLHPLFVATKIIENSK